MKKYILLPLLVILLFSCESENASLFEDDETEESVTDDGMDNEEETDDQTNDEDSGNDDGTDDDTENEDDDSGNDDETDDDAENEDENDADGDGISDDEDTCLDCATEDFDFSLCDNGPDATVYITNADGTEETETIMYTDDIDFEALTSLSCEQIVSFYVNDSTPTDNCFSCGVVEVCENEDDETFTAIYNDKSASINYEEGETFESLSCEGLLTRYLAEISTTN